MIPVEKPFSAVVSDILGPLPLTRSRNRYVVVVTDRCTNWVVAWSTSDISAATVARGLLERLICIHGCPHRLQSDQYTSRVLADICRMLDTHQAFSTAYAPQTQGKVERFNRTFADMLAKVVDNN